MRRWTLLVLLASGCTADEATVRIDLAELVQRAAQDEFQAVELVVTGTGVDITEPLDPVELTFEIEVPSGPARTFAIEAYDPGAQRTTIYWGHTTTDLEPGAVVELTIPIAPAGRISGIVSLSDGATVPPTQISCTRGTHQNPRLTGPFTGTAEDGAFSIPLPEGDYQVTAESVSVDGATYTQQEAAFIDVYRGQVGTQLDLVLERVCVVGGEVECCVNADCTEPSETCNLDTNQCQPAQVVVRVVDSANVPYNDGATVYVHDSAGTYVSQYTTDALGEAAVEVASGDMVSVLHLYNDGNSDNYCVLTAAGVEPGGTVPFRLPGYVSQPSVLEGTLNVFSSLSAPADTVDQMVSVAGWSYSLLAAGGPTSFNIYTWMLNDSQALDVLGWARDQSGAILGFAAHPGLPRTGGDLTIGDSGWDESLATLNLTFANLPGTQRISMSQIRGGQPFYHGQSVDPVSGPGSYTFPVGFFDYIDVIAYTGASPAEQRLHHRFVNETWPSPVAIDFDTFIDPIDTGTSPYVDWTVPARPAVIWTTTALPATYDATLVNLEISYTDRFVWWLVAPSGTTTPAMPDLSNAPAGFQPQTYQAGYPMMAIELRESDLFANYRSYLATFGVRDMDELPEQQLTIRSSSYRELD